MYSSCWIFVYIAAENFITPVSSKPLHVIRGTGNGISGVTTLRDEVYVAHFGSTEIIAYDAATFDVRRRLSLHGATANRSSLTACGNNDCLYMSHHTRKRVYRIELTGSNAVTSWCIGSPFVGLSVTGDSNVLMAVDGHQPKIREYTSHGYLVREIALPCVRCPLYAIQLPSGHLGVTTVGNYYVLDTDGRVTRCCSSPLDRPFGLTVDERGTAFVADHYTDRVLMLDLSTLAAAVCSAQRASTTTRRTVVFTSASSWAVSSSSASKN